jgi:hypothetical protein
LARKLPDEIPFQPPPADFEACRSSTFFSLSAAAGVVGEALLKHSSTEFIRLKVRDCGQDAMAAKLPLQFLSMQKYVYSFQSSVGTFRIRPERDKSWGLYIGGEGIVELLGYYDSAFAAADSVYMQTLGIKQPHVSALMPTEPAPSPSNV